jgi:unspecific monooxygenase
MTASDLFIPPRPAIQTRDLNWYRLLKALRTNALGMWPERAYEQDTLVNKFFGRQRVLLNAPEAIHHVLVENAANYRRSPATVRILRPIVGDGLFLGEGEEWKHQRRTIAPSLAPRVLPLLARHVAQVAQEAVQRLTATRGEPVDLLAGMQFLALEIAGRSMFSLEMQRHGAALRRLIVQFGARLGRPYLFDMLLPPSIPTLRDLARRQFRAQWTGLMDQIIEARMAVAPEGGPRDLFDVLRAARDPETGATFSRDQLRDQVATLIVAGHETTALALFWSLYLLASAPAVQRRLAVEVAGIDLSPERIDQALAGLPYTRAVVSEALRLYPPAFVIVREAVAADRWRDVAIPPRSLAMVAPWVLHRHRRYWQNPDAFDPARFLEGAPQIHRMAYLPFGTGPRVCVGAQFALTEAVLVLAILIQKFTVELIDTEPVLPAAVVTTQPDRAAAFRLQRRRS